MPFQGQSFFYYDQYVIKLAKTSVRQAEFESKFKKEIEKSIAERQIFAGIKGRLGPIQVYNERVAGYNSCPARKYFLRGTSKLHTMLIQFSDGELRISNRYEIKYQQNIMYQLMLKQSKPIPCERCSVMLCRFASNSSTLPYPSFLHKYYTPSRMR